jgi:hypothetical protein
MLPRQLVSVLAPAATGHLVPAAAAAADVLVSLLLPLQAS